MTRTELLQKALTHDLEGRSGPTNSDSPISVISARWGDGIARSNGEEDGKKAKKKSFRGVQGTGGIGGDSGRQDAFRGSPSTLRSIPTR